MKNKSFLKVEFGKQSVEYQAQEEGVIQFYTTNDTAKAQEISKELDTKIIPTHPDIDAGCGYLLKVEWENFCSLLKLLEEEKINYKGLYYSKKVGVKRKISLLYKNE